MGSKIHPTSTLMPTCRYQKIYPTEYDEAHVAGLLWELKEAGDNTPQEFREFHR